MKQPIPTYVLVDPHGYVDWEGGITHDLDEIDPTSSHDGYTLVPVITLTPEEVEWMKHAIKCYGSWEHVDEPPESLRDKVRNL